MLRQHSELIGTFKNNQDFYNEAILSQITVLIQQTVKQLANKYNVPLNQVNIHYNKRYRTVLGCYNDSMQNTLRGICDITFNEKFVLGCYYDAKNNGQETLLKTVTHEALHYIAHFINNGNNSDGSSNFEQLLADNNSISSAETANNKRIADTENIIYNYRNKELYRTTFL